MADLTATVLELRSTPNHPNTAQRLEDSKPPRQAASAKQINKAVAKYVDVTMRDLIGNSRRQNVVWARALAAYLIRTIHGFSYGEIGRHLGDRDHTTVLHAVRRAKKLLETDLEFKQAAMEMMSTLE